MKTRSFKNNIEFTAKLVKEHKDMEIPEDALAILLAAKVGDKTQEVVLAYLKEDLERSSKEQIVGKFCRQVELLNELVQEKILEKEV